MWLSSSMTLCVGSSVRDVDASPLPNSATTSRPAAPGRHPRPRRDADVVVRDEAGGEHRRARRRRLEPRSVMVGDVVVADRRVEAAHRDLHRLDRFVLHQQALGIDDEAVVRVGAEDDLAEHGPVVRELRRQEQIELAEAERAGCGLPVADDEAHVGEPVDLRLRRLPAVLGRRVVALVVFVCGGRRRGDAGGLATAAATGTACAAASCARSVRTSASS